MFPLMINLKQKKVVVVGGGKVAARRIQVLLKEQPRITVVSPALEAGMQAYAANGAIAWINREFQREDVADAFLVIAATDHVEVNQFIKSCCTEQQLVNVADDPAGSSFHFPAVYDSNGITVAVTTTGISPKLTQNLRDQFAAMIDELDPAYLLFLKKVRETVTDKTFSGKHKQCYLEECLKMHYRTDADARRQFLREISHYKNRQND